MAHESGTADPSEVTGQTKAQVLTTTSSMTGELGKGQPAQWDAKVRVMRRHPTIAFCRQMYMAPALAADWAIESTEGAPEGARELVEDVLFPVRNMLLRSSLAGGMDWGWQSYEKVWWRRPSDGAVVPRKLKQLLQDYTWLTVDPYGALTGLTNTARNAGFTIDKRLAIEQALVVYYDVEGTNWYGQATMRNVETAYDSWTHSEAAGDKYMKKVAGAHWIVYYPVGVTPFNGVDTPNDQIAASLISTLEASGAIAIPDEIQSWLMDDAARDAKGRWRIELLSDSSGSTFTERQNHNEVQMARGLFLPERAVFEGQYGTKAEAGEHANFALASIEARHRDTLLLYNWHMVNQLLRLNYGLTAEGTVWLTAMPLADAKKTFLTDLYTTILGSPMGPAEVEVMDLRVIRGFLGIPTDEEAITEMEKEEKRKNAPNPFDGTEKTETDDEDDEDDNSQ